MNENINLKDLSKELYSAVREYNKDIHSIENVLNQGASLLRKNENGRTELHRAAINENLNQLELLYGENINEKDNAGMTPLHKAARNGNLESCKMLLNNGADMNITDNNDSTTLHFAAMSGNVKCCEFFINKELNVNTINIFGDTPLHDAASRGNLECCKYLVENHANFNIKNKSEENPLLLVLYRYNLSNHGLQVCKYFFQLGVELQNVPPSWNNYKIKNFKSLQICWKWWTKQQNRGQELIDIPEEILKRGSEAIDIYCNEIYKSQNRIYRSRICVVGPSSWGKTSLIQSLISSTPTQVPADTRTIGIDQFQWRFEVVKEDNDLQNANTTEPNILNDSGNIEKHQVSFWDFAGQDVYKGAHSIFFSSSRTLFLICVNLQLYDQDIKNEQNNASDEVLRWIRLIFAKQPNAKLRFVGTKADLVDEYSIYSIQEDLSECVQQWCDKYSTNINTRQSLLSENGREQRILQQLQVQLSNIKHAVNQKWVISSSKDEHKLKETCAEIQRQIRDSNLGFIMPDSYTEILDYLYQLRQDARSITNISSAENVNTISSSNTSIQYDYDSGKILHIDNIFCSQQNLKGRIRKVIPQVISDSIPNDSGGHEATNTLLDEILELFNDLGEILLFNNMKLNRKNGVVIVDPGLMIDLVRDIVRHDLCQYLELSDVGQKLQSCDWKDQLKNGILCHTIFPLLPIWGKLTNGQRRVAQEILYECQVLHPVGGIKRFESTTNVVVPSLWFLNIDAKYCIPDMEEAITRRYADKYVESCITWEYEFSENTLPESFFELFVVKSYHYNMESIVQPNSLEVWVPNTESLGLVTFNLSESDHNIIKIEVASTSQEMALQLVQYILSAIENLLNDYPGVSKTPYIVESRANDSQVRHVVNSGFIHGRFCSTANYDYLDEDLFLCYYKEFSVDHADLDKLSDMMRKKKAKLQQEKECIKSEKQTTMIQHINEKVGIGLNNQRTMMQYQLHMNDKLEMGLNNQEILMQSQSAIFRVLCIGEESRRVPLLWTAQLEHDDDRICIRMLSDISGKCYHTDNPILIDVPSNILFKHGKKLKYGLNVLSTVVPDLIPLDQIDLSSEVGKAEKIYNLIEGCKLQKHGIINASTDVQISPEESKLLLLDFLKLYDPQFTLDQIPRLSGLVCGFINTSGHHLWAAKEEFDQYEDQITIRNGQPIDVQALFGVQKFTIDLSICQVDELIRGDQKNVFLKWQVVDANNNNEIIDYGITPCHGDKLVKPNWKDTIRSIGLKNFDQLKQLILRISVRRYRKMKFPKLREFKDLGEGEKTFLDVLHSYSNPPSNSIPISVQVFLNQTKTCTVTCQLEFPSGNVGRSSTSKVP